MSWEWDRGTTKNDPFAAGDLDLDGFGRLIDYSETREREDAELDRLRNDPAVLAMVSKRVKKSIGRTADIPIRCGKSDIRKSLAFGVIGGSVELVMVFHADSSFADSTTLQCRLTGEETSNVPMQFTCLCDATQGPGGSRLALTAKRLGSRRTRLWLYKAALAALASDTRKRPVVQLHT